MAKTLTDLKGNDEVKAKPYPTAITKVKVIKVGHTASFMGSGGESAKMLNFSIADSGAAALATLNDATKFDSIKEGKFLIIRNFMTKNGRLILTKHTKIMSGPSIEVSEEVATKAHLLICPPSPSTKLSEVKHLPRRSLVTVRGQITKDESVKEVKVGSEPASIHTVRLSEDGEEVDLSLWRDAANVSIKVGDYIEVSQCVTGEWNRAITLNTTRNSVVQIVEAPEIDMEGHIEGLFLAGDEVEVVVCVGNDYNELRLKKSTLMNALHMADAEDMEDVVSALLPLSAKMIVKNCSIQSIEIIREGPGPMDNSEDTSDRGE